MSHARQEPQHTPAMRPLLAFVAVLALVGCSSDSTGPEERVPATGRYALYFKPGGPAADPPAIRGTLVVTSASPDSMRGRWEVSAYEDEVRMGVFVPDTRRAYLLLARRRGSAGLYSHRVWRSGGPRDLSCEGVYDHGGGETYPSQCTLTYEGPV